MEKSATKGLPSTTIFQLHVEYQQKIDYMTIFGVSDIYRHGLYGQGFITYHLGEKLFHRINGIGKEEKITMVINYPISQ